MIWIVAKIAVIQDLTGLEDLHPSSFIWLLAGLLNNSWALGPSCSFLMNLTMRTFECLHNIAATYPTVNNSQHGQNEAKLQGFYVLASEERSYHFFYTILLTQTTLAKLGGKYPRAWREQSLGPCWRLLNTKGRNLVLIWGVSTKGSRRIWVMKKNLCMGFKKICTEINIFNPFFTNVLKYSHRCGWSRIFGCRTLT